MKLLPLIVLSGLAAVSLAAHEGHSHAPAASKKLVSPISGSPEDLAAGRKLYGEHCASCHGADGRGSAVTSKVKPADLTSHHIAALTPGEIYWVTTHGIPMSGMPATLKLTVRQRWQIVAYLRTLANPK